jgi:hypothetical protein
MPHPVRARLFALPLVLSIACLTAVACRPKAGADRFLGTFRWRQMFGYQAVTFEKGSKASYTFVTPGEGDEDPPKTEVLPSTYHVLGDTAFMLVEWPDPKMRGDTLSLLLRGDTLVMLNQVLGGNPIFVRGD